MAEMRTLTVNGKTYTVADPDSVSYGAAQSLTEEQKARGRQNIGAGTATIDDTKAGADAWSSKNIVDRLCPAFTESGAVVTCQPVEGYPLEVVSQIEPVQEGSGEPSPDNVRPITGHTGAKLWRGGKNLLPTPYYEESRTLNGVQFAINDDSSVTLSGTSTSSMSFRLRGIGSGVNSEPLPMTVIPGETYTLSIDNPLPSGARVVVYFYDAERSMCNTYIVTSQSSTSAKVPENAAYWWVIISLNKDVTIDCTLSVMLTHGSSSGGYEPYRGENFTLDFGQTVYGGSFNRKTGVLTVDTVKKIFDGTETLTKYATDTGGFSAQYNPVGAQAKLSSSVCSHFKNVDYAFASQYADTRGIFCDHPSVITKYFRAPNDSVTDIERFKVWLKAQADNGTPVELAYKLADPLTVQLTPQQILALSGTNVLCSDTGDTAVTGRGDPISIIAQSQERLAAMEAAVVNNT